MDGTSIGVSGESIFGGLSSRIMFLSLKFKVRDEKVKLQRYYRGESVAQNLG